MLGDPGLFQGSVASFPPDVPRPCPHYPILMGGFLGIYWEGAAPQPLRMNKRRGWDILLALLLPDL